MSGVVLLALKLDGLLNASWWLVLLPVWLLFVVEAFGLQHAWQEISVAGASSRQESERAYVSAVASGVRSKACCPERPV